MKRRVCTAERMLGIIKTLRACDRTVKELAMTVGANRRVIERMLQKLQKHDLIEPAGIGESRRGQRPIIWRFK